MAATVQHHVWAFMYLVSTILHMQAVEFESMARASRFQKQHLPEIGLAVPFPPFDTLQKIHQKGCCYTLPY